MCRNASSGEVSYIKVVECDHELHGAAKFEEAETNKSCATTLLLRFYAAFSNHYVSINLNLLWFFHWRVGCKCHYCIFFAI